MKSIPIQVKKTCCQMKDDGVPVRQIYEEYYKKQIDTPTLFSTFRRDLIRWRSKDYPDDMTLNAGTYEGFVAHGATVQVSSNGEIVQAWIKQNAQTIDPVEFIEAIKQNVEPYKFTSSKTADAKDVLEIPLFDMHWGVAFFDYYQPTLEEILALIQSQPWKRIIIPFGQDFFHNDSIVNGQTTKGTTIEKVNMTKAVYDGKRFMFSIIDSALSNADEVYVPYSPGNHDRSISWMFMQVLLERYGSDIVDDSIEFRKVFTYGTNAVMITHGDSKRATPNNLAHIFPISFPKEYTGAVVREVHAGHLHCEADADVFGVMVRRLSSGGKTDEWTDREDFVGTHKRFMIFVWSEDKLKAIRYI